ncbi:MAG: carbon-nitrogen hydrolase [Myxococcota bacterium]|nr:carbon-nitrogen hydrolase [Myxococcales bacterium]
MASPTAQRATPRSPVVRVGLVQMRCVDDADANLAKALDGIADAARRGAKLVCLQELFRNPYPCQDEDPDRFDWAEPVPGPSTEALGKAAAEHGVAIVASLFERRAPGLYHNTAALLDETGAVRARYRKLHIPDDPLYYEKFYFAPGDLGIPVERLAGAPVATLVCWDQWYPEGARLAALGGAQILFYPTAIGWQHDVGGEVDTAQHAAWETMQRSHAIANGVFVVAVNRTGEERLPGSDAGIRFWGQSFVADPFGRVIAKAPADEEAVLVVECDLALVERTRRDWPFLRDRRIDVYADLAKRFRDD